MSIIIVNTVYEQVHTESFSCRYEGSRMNMLVFRMHAHTHSLVSTLYRVRGDEWLRVGKVDPLLPQVYRAVEPRVVVEPGDVLVGACSYRNDEDRVIHLGNSIRDENCHNYFIYYADEIDEPQWVCIGSQFPELESRLPDEAYFRPDNSSSRRFCIDQELLRKFT